MLTNSHDDAGTNAAVDRLASQQASNRHRRQVVARNRDGPLFMKRWHALSLGTVLIVANFLLILFAACGAWGSSNPMVYLQLAAIWAVWIVVDIMGTVRSTSQDRWPVCCLRVGVACLGIYINLSAVDQIMYVTQIAGSTWLSC